MKRIKLFGWNKKIGMTSRYNNHELELIPIDHESGQMMFRFMAE
jgi:hypothetical protein